jgi:hypothetical protein
MPFTSITTADIQVKKPVKQELMQTIKDDLDYFNTQAYDLFVLPNASFEIDSDSDGTPDRWNLYLYPGGTAARTDTDQTHGLYSMKFTHPGGPGNGGGYLYSDYVQCSPLCAYNVALSIKCSVAGMFNSVSVWYYDKDQVYISLDYIYASSANPTSWTRYVGWVNPPATARYMRIYVVGGVPDNIGLGTDVAGDIYFDNILLKEMAMSYVAGDVVVGMSVGEVETRSSADYEEKLRFTLPVGGSLKVRFSLKCSTALGTAYGRIYKNGVAAGTERTEGDAKWVTYSETFTSLIAGDYLSLYMKVSDNNYDSVARAFSICSNTPAELMLWASEMEDLT